MRWWWCGSARCMCPSLGPVHAYPKPSKGDISTIPTRSYFLVILSPIKNLHTNTYADIDIYNSSSLVVLKYFYLYLCSFPLLLTARCICTITTWNVPEKKYSWQLSMHQLSFQHISFPAHFNWFLSYCMAKFSILNNISRKKQFC